MGWAISQRRNSCFCCIRDGVEARNGLPLSASGSLGGEAITKKAIAEPFAPQWKR